MKKTMLILMLLSIAVSQCFAKSSGTTTAAFLQFGAGGRAAGIGDAYTAGCAEDAFGEYWNIGAVAFIDKPTKIGFMHNSIYQDMSHNYISYSRRLKNLSALAVSISYFDIDKLEQYRVGANNLPQYVGSFGSKNYVFSAGYSKQFEKLLNKPFSAGAKLKSIQAKIGGYSASALAIDIGGYLKYNDELNLGAALKNFGTKMKFFTEKEDLPLCFSIGANYKVIPQLTLALDLSAP